MNTTKQPRQQALVSKSHAAGGFGTQVNADAQEVCWASRFAAFAADTIFSAGRGGDLSGFAAVPGNHLQNVSRASANALGAADAGVVNFD